MRFLTSLAFALPLVFGTAPARAEDKIRLKYRAPAECPSEEAFSADVRSRLASDWEAGPSELANVFDVEITSAGERFKATIHFRDAEGQPLERVVEGPSCSDVTNAMVLVTVLAVRSRVEATPKPCVASPAVSAPTAPSASPPAPTPTPLPPPPPERSLYVRAGGLGYVTTGVGPGASFGGGLMLGAEASRARLGLTLAGFGSGRVSANGFPSEYQLLLARVDACPLAFEVAGPLGFEPCALLEVGSLHAETFTDSPTVTAAGSASAIWLSPGLLARLVARFDSLWLGVEGFVRFPLFQERFYVNAGQPLTAFEVPGVAVGAGLGAGLRL